MPSLVRHQPDLQQVQGLGVRRVHLAVADAGAGGHVLQLAGDKRLARAGRVLMLHRAFQDVGEDLHVAVGVLAKPHGWSNIVLVDDAQGAEAHLFGVVVVGKAEAEVRIQPAVIGMAAICCCS